MLQNHSVCFYAKKTFKIKLNPLVTKYTDTLPLNFAHIINPTFCIPPLYVALLLIVLLRIRRTTTFKCIYQCIHRKWTIYICFSTTRVKDKMFYTIICLKIWFNHLVGDRWNQARNCILCWKYISINKAAFDFNNYQLSF